MTTTKGRPSEYSEEYIGKVEEYLDSRQDEEYEFHKTRGSKSDSYEEKIIVRLPTIEGFALFLGVNKTSLYEWEKKHEDFSNALDKIREEQRKRLLDKGLSGQYNPVIAKLILSSNHGMAEKTETKNSLVVEVADREKSKEAISQFLNGNS